MPGLLEPSTASYPQSPVTELVPPLSSPLPCLFGAKEEAKKESKKKRRGKRRNKKNKQSYVEPTPQNIYTGRSYGNTFHHDDYHYDSYFDRFNPYLDHNNNFTCNQENYAAPAFDGPHHTTPFHTPLFHATNSGATEHLNNKNSNTQKTVQVTNLCKDLQNENDKLKAEMTSMRKSKHVKIRENKTLQSKIKMLLKIVKKKDDDLIELNGKVLRLQTSMDLKDFQI